MTCPRCTFRRCGSGESKLCGPPEGSSTATLCSRRPGAGVCPSGARCLTPPVFHFIWGPVVCSQSPQRLLNPCCIRRGLFPSTCWMASSEPPEHPMRRGDGSPPHAFTEARGEHLERARARKACVSDSNPSCRPTREECVQLGFPFSPMSQDGVHKLRASVCKLRWWDMRVAPSGESAARGSLCSQPIIGVI